MDTGTFTALVLLGSIAAGLLGSLTGLGGGVIIIPLLVQLLGVDLRYAIGASLIAVIATSSGAAAAFIREGYTNIRVGMLLEVATTVGAVMGAYAAQYLPKGVIGVIFGLVLLWTAAGSFRARKERASDATPDPLATRLRLDSTYPERDATAAGGVRMVPYHVRQVPGAFGVMFGAGVLSAVVGIGSGIVKVLAMDRMMRLPFKVSTTTSNFMIGVTAAASAGVYLHRGQIDPGIAAPVAVGALIGAFVGAKLLHKVKVKPLRIIFACIVAYAGVRMVWQGVMGTL